MSKKEQQNLIDTLTIALSQSECIWQEGEKSHAFIVGYLQGAIKSAITDIKFNTHK
jgi:predicted amidophosphoribosyltransferase